MNPRGPSFQMVMPWTTAVKWLVISNVAIWLVLQIVVEKLIFHQPGWITQYFGLTPIDLLDRFYLWQPLTYMFLHSTQNLSHLLFNMLMLWMTGSELEARWGSRFFFLYYMICGIGAGVLYVLTILVYGVVMKDTSAWTDVVVGASGGIFGLLLAYGIIFGERTVYFMMIFPMKARYFVMILGAILFVGILNDGLAGGPGRVSHLCHLGGLVSGFCFLKFWTWYQQRQWKRRSNPRSGRRLKLIVNNEDLKTKSGPGGSDDNDGGPRYWN